MIEKPSMSEFRLQVEEILKRPLIEREIIAMGDFWEHFEKIQAGVDVGEIHILIDPMWLRANHPEYGRPYYSWMTSTLYTLGIILLFLIPPLGIAMISFGFIYSTYGKKGGQTFTENIVQRVKGEPNQGGMAFLLASYILLTVGLSSKLGNSKWHQYPSCVFSGELKFIP